MLHKLRGRICTVFFECFQVAKTAVLINCSILIEFLARSIANKAGRGDEFNVDLDALAGILHLLVRLGNILGIWQFDRHLAASCKHAVQAGDGACIAALAQLDPEHHQTGVGVPAAHISNQLQLCFCMLVRVAVGPMRAVCQRLQRPIIALLPPVDILAVGAVTDRCFCDSVFLSIPN